MEVNLDGLDGVLHPGPGIPSDGAAVKLPSATRAFGEVIDSAAARAALWPAELDGDPTLVAHAHEVRVAWLERRRLPLDAEREGVAIAMFGCRPRQEVAVDPGPKLLRYHAAAAGLPFAFEAQLVAAELRYELGEVSWSRGRVSRVADAKLVRDAPTEHLSFNRAWLALQELRARLGGASADDLAACELIAQRRWETAPTYARAVAAYLLPHVPELADRVADVRGEKRPVPLLVQSLRDPARVVRLVVDGTYGIESALLVALVRIGAPLAAPMIAMLSSAQHGQRHEAARVLGRIGTPEVADALIDAVRREEVHVETIEPFLLRFPALALPRLEARGMTEAHARVLRAHPELDPNAGPVAPLASLPEPLRKPTTRALPEFWQPSEWPRLANTRGEGVPAPAVHRLGELLIDADGESTAELLEVRAALDPRALGDFLFAALDAWAEDYRATREKWLLHGLAPMLGESGAERLGTAIRKWTGNAYAKAVTGLNVLAAIDGEQALLQLGYIAAKHRTRGVRDAAARVLSRIAQQRGMSRAELDDRLVPTLGLDPHGAMTLDYGSRRFEVRFDESLNPWLVDERGAIVKTPPKPGAKDDLPRATAALAAYKQLKKDARTIASTQVARLQDALVSQRRWKYADATRFLFRHPLLSHLARRLVWAHEGGLFRIDEEGALVDLHDDAVVIADDDAPVWLAHPVTLDPPTRDAWGEVLADYELVAPFPQLGRPIHRPQDASTAAVLASLRGLTVTPGAIRGLLARGWRRAGVEDAGIYYGVERELGGTHVELRLREGVSVTAWHGEQHAVIDHAEVIEVGDAIGFSETIRELASLVR